MAKKYKMGKDLKIAFMFSFFALLGYYVGDFLGVTTWAFNKPFYILFPSLLVWYGIFLYLAWRFVIKKILRLK